MVTTSYEIYMVAKPYRTGFIIAKYGLSILAWKLIVVQILSFEYNVCEWKSLTLTTEPNPTLNYVVVYCTLKTKLQKRKKILK